MKPTDQSASIAMLRVVVLALSLLLIHVGIVRASHYHSHEIAAQADNHLDCAICLDANHVGAMTAQATTPVLARIWRRVPQVPAKPGRSRACACVYDARGPPAA